MNVAPQPIENAINESPYIAQSLVLGENRNYVICLINPEFETLAQWAKSKGIKEESTEELCEHPKVREMFEEEVARLTKNFTNYAQPKKIVIANKEWTIETGELTPKLSLRTNIVEEKYARLIEAAYSEDQAKQKEVG